VVRLVGLVSLISLWLPARPTKRFASARTLDRGRRSPDRPDRWFAA
jgi:hypothetical protein